MTNARQKILNYIVEQQSATVDELSKVFRVTPANIRHHLSILVEQGSLKIVGEKALAGKGRPAQIFSVAQQSNKNNLDQLSDTLLTTLLDAAHGEDINEILRQIARRMVGNHAVDKHNPTQRLYSSIRALNHMNYQAHWEAHLENPRIMLGHCPYLPILEHHPEVCQLDAYVLRELLDTPVRQTQKLTTNEKGLGECVFLLSKRGI